MVFDRLGIDPRSAIELFLTEVASRKAIPFALALPDSEYAAAEYGLTTAEVAAAGRRMRRATASARKAGTARAVRNPADLLA